MTYLADTQTHTDTHTEIITIPSAPLNRDAQHKLSVRTNKHEERIVENCRKWNKKIHV